MGGLPGQPEGMGGLRGAGSCVDVSVGLEKSLPSQHAQPALGGPCGAPRTATPAAASCTTPSLAARRLLMWTLPITPPVQPC